LNKTNLGVASLVVGKWGENGEKKEWAYLNLVLTD